jgi:hypothetical protein
MPTYPQYANSQLVEYGNYLYLTQGTGVSHSANPEATCAAAPGDIIINEVASGDATAYTVTLPEVALGGPVEVKVVAKSGAAAGFGNVSNTVTIIPTVADTVAGCLIDGWGSIQLIQPNASVVLASDGTNWWIISRSHQTTDTW